MLSSGIKKRLKRMFSSENILLISIIILLFIYFVYHTINGDRGVLISFKLSEELQEKTKRLEEITKEKMLLEQKVHLLSPDSLDLDLLDEIARKKLGLVGKDEVVIYPQNP